MHHVGEKTAEVDTVSVMLYINLFHVQSGTYLDSIGLYNICTYVYIVVLCREIDI